jgi:uncharacterized protein YndB with AHSA1/START domain
LEEIEMKWMIRIVGTLVGVLVLGAVVLLAMGQRSTAGQSRASAELNAPRERVWEWINNGNKVKQWVSWTVDVRDEGEKRTMVMRDENNGGKLMDIYCTVAASTPPSRLQVNMSSPEGFDGVATYELIDVGGGRTKLDVHHAYRMSMWLAKLIEPLITSSAEKKLTSDLANLKRLVEASSE